MVTKLELLLLVAIVLFVASWNKQESLKVKKTHKSKALLAEVIDPVYTEIDINQSKRVVISKKAKQYKSRVDFEQFDYKSEKIKLVSKFAREKKGIYTAWGNVVAVKPDGTVYKGSKAIVHKKKDLLEFKNKFTILDGENSVIGNKMMYNESGSTVKAKNVKAIYDMATPKDK